MVKQQRMASSDWRIVLEGSAPALPKKFFGASEDAPSSYGILGSPGGSPSQKPSEFGAQKKTCHQPLAKASGMDR
jgi:hypothetical protein